MMWSVAEDDGVDDERARHHIDQQWDVDPGPILVDEVRDLVIKELGGRRTERRALGKGKEKGGRERKREKS